MDRKKAISPSTVSRKGIEWSGLSRISIAAPSGVCERGVEFEEENDVLPGSSCCMSDQVSDVSQFKACPRCRFVNFYHYARLSEALGSNTLCLGFIDSKGRYDTALFPGFFLCRTIKRVSPSGIFPLVTYTSGDSVHLCRPHMYLVSL